MSWKNSDCFAIGSLCLADAPYHLHEACDNFTDDQIREACEAAAINRDVSDTIALLWQEVHDNLYDARRDAERQKARDEEVKAHQRLIDERREYET